MKTAMTRSQADIVPRRIFLDTCTFQAFADCGGFVFDADEFPLADVQAEHIAIFNAIASGSPQEARKAAEEHLRGAANRLALHLNTR
jgi:DNA-binding FadR family transcriptional regulator